MSSLPTAVMVAFSLFATTADARIHRSAAEVLAFKRANPCPSTEQRRGTCPGWQVDHIQPLCSGGPGTVANMQWLSVPNHRTKTRQDVLVCRVQKTRLHQGISL